MELGLNGASTRRADLATDIAITAAAGYELIELRDDKLDAYLAQGNTPEDLDARLGSAGIRALSINSLEGFVYPPSGQTRESLRERCSALCRVAGAIDCPWIIAVPGARPAGVSDLEAVEEAARELDRLGELAAPHGVRVALEFIGWQDNAVRTLGAALEVLDAAGREDLGLVIDTFHFHVGGSDLADLERVPASRLAVLHINDAEDRPLEQLTDAHRLYPGEGVLPLGPMLLRLRQVGFAGPASVELFRPEYWERDPGRVAREAHAATVAALQGGGLW